MPLNGLIDDPKRLMPIDPIGAAIEGIHDAWHGLGRKWDVSSTS